MLVMGCSGSKEDEASLVVLCRERKQYIKAASECRNSLAASHVEYFNSLGSVGEALVKFAEEELALGSPVLHLPSREGKLSSPSTSTSFSHSPEDFSARRIRKKDKRHKSATLHTDGNGGGRLNNDGEGSHLDLSSSSEEGLDSDHAPPRDDIGIHGGFENPRENYWGPGHENYFHPPQVSRQPPGRVWEYFYPETGNLPPYPYPYPVQYPSPPYYHPVYENGNFNSHYMRKTPTQPRRVVYEDPSSAVYSSSGFYDGETGARNPSEMAGPVPENKPPPPSPRASTWDFFNLFEGFDVGYGENYSCARYGHGSQTSSPDSKEVREREGIPDLEDERVVEVVKEISNEEEDYGTQKKTLLDEDARPDRDAKEPIHSTRRRSKRGIVNGGSPDAPRSYPVSPEEEEISHFVVEEAVAVDLDSPKISSLSTLSHNGTCDLKEAALEVKKEFESASGCGKEVAMMLEVGELPYHKRRTLLKVIYSRILYLLSSHCSSVDVVSPTTAKMAREYSDNIDLNKKCLSSTLQQLYAWEKKLYKEVKDEERLRIEYDKLCRRLHNLERRGAEPGKINATQSAIRTLLTKIDVCVHAVVAISSKINRLRDEELHPQIIQLIFGCIRMWKSMVRCHQKQVEAMMESKARYLLPNPQGDSGLKAITDLEHEIITWCSLFNKWITSQKSYIESLNQWLSRCLVRESEETADGPAPFSPARIGAPPIFVICNDWHQTMTAVSDKLVETTMLDFASTLHQLWALQDEQQRQPRKGEELRRRSFEKRLQKMRLGIGMVESLEVDSAESGVSRLNALKKEELVAMKKKLQVERSKQRSGSKSVQDGLIPIFEALGNFSSDVLKAHEQVRVDYTPGGE